MYCKQYNVRIYQNSIVGAEAVIKSLIAEGIEVIFGYPGGAIMPIYDALWHYQDRINHVLTRHEQGATHAAEGWARVKGKAVVCFATSGPGDQSNHGYCGCYNG